MRPDPQTITLGDKSWTIRPLTLAQIRDIEQELLKSGRDGNGNIPGAIAIVAIALRRDHPGAVDALSEVEATATEIAAAMTVVLRLAGFLTAQRDQPPPGETPAAVEIPQTETASGGVSTAA